jgi:hypothetical protein
MHPFQLDIPDAQVGYRNLRRAEFLQEQAINEGALGGNRKNVPAGPARRGLVQEAHHTTSC